MNRVWSRGVPDPKLNLMPSAMYVAVYDVTENREREQLAKVLEGYGLRVQNSVFECRLTVSSRNRLMQAVERLDLKSGFLYLYRIAGHSKRLQEGKVPARPYCEEQYAFVVEEPLPPPSGPTPDTLDS